jgi:acyl-CoA synthetase (AMP-forming)/AMP-acid ligase II
MSTILSRMSADLLAEYYRSGCWKDESLYDVLCRHAQNSPDNFAVRDRLRRISFRDLLRLVDRVAAVLKARGVRTGERVAVWSPSRVETVVVMLACSRNGYVFCPSLHRDHTVGEVLELLARMRATALFAETGYGADAAKRRIFDDAGLPTTLKSSYQLTPLGAVAASELPFVDLPDESQHSETQSANRISYLAFTSGTTGQPKGVMHTDNTLMASSRAVVADWNLDGQSVIYTMSPLSHNLGIGAAVAALLAGAEVVVHDLPRGNSLLQRISEIGATYLVGVPTHAIDLVTEVRAQHGTTLAAVKGFRISGAAVPSEIVAELIRYGTVPQSGYGTTETCSHQYTLPTDSPELITKTSGRAYSGFETRIWSREDRNAEVTVGEVGQIGCRGASVMMGYFDDQAATESAFNDTGWYMTGDLGSLDAAGYLKIHGREKDLIIRGGHNIHPAHIESLAMQHASVERAAAFPVDDLRLGEKVCLAVILRNGQQAKPQDLLRHLDSAGLSRYDMPEYFMELERFPLTSSGKILKRELVAMARDGRLKPEPVRWQATKTDA